MEKVMYVLWRDPDEPSGSFAIRLRETTAPALVTEGARGVQVNVLDDDVSGGSGVVPDGLRRVATSPQMEAVISLWLDSAVDHLRERFDKILNASAPRHSGYLVCESEPVRNDAHRAPEGSRTPGFAQLAFLQRPEGLDRDRWLDRWRNHHTDVAVETQSTFEYRQNLVIERLDPNGPQLDGIVEESFPIEALTDRRVFYDAVDDDSRFAVHRRRMSESTRTFIDHESGLDVLPTSQYVIASAFR